MPEIVRHNRIPANIPTAEHTQFWKGMDERKGCEPSDLSHDHYKVVARDPLLAQFDASLRQLPYQHGFSPDGWKQMTAVQLWKKLDLILVHKLRTIVLMSSQFNTNNKKLGRDVMHHTEELGLLPPDQGGSRKDHQSNELGLNKVLAFDLLRQLRQSGALCCNDAKSCYDRIVHAIAIPCMVRLGCLFAPIISMFKTLQAGSIIQDKNGLRRLRYYGKKPKHTTIPRSRTRQQMWPHHLGCSQCTHHPNALHSRLWYDNHVSTFRHIGRHCMLRLRLCQRHRYNTFLNRHNRQTDGHEMQAVMDTWEGRIRATGGALEPSKCHWYLIDFKWIPP
jgi:hypothetical protein